MHIAGIAIANSPWLTQVIVVAIVTDSPIALVAGVGAAPGIPVPRMCRCRACVRVVVGVRRSRTRSVRAARISVVALVRACGPLHIGPARTVVIGWVSGSLLRSRLPLLLRLLIRWMLRRRCGLPLLRLLPLLRRRTRRTARRGRAALLLLWWR